MIDDEQSPITVWDWPLRAFHWLFASSIAVSALVVYGKFPVKLHLAAGTLAFLLALGRIIWAFTGSRYARIEALVRPFSQAKLEFIALKNNLPPITPAHPVAAGWVMATIILCVIAVAVSGFLVYFADESSPLQLFDESRKEQFLYLHEIFSTSLLMMAFIHLQGVALHIFLHSDGIVMSMIDGEKYGKKAQGVEPLSTKQHIFGVVWIAFSCLGALAWVF